MKHKRFTRLVSVLLVLATLFSLVALPASAKTLGNSGTVKIKADGRHEILSKSTGGSLGSNGWDFTSNDGITGTAYCVNWGLKNVSPSKSLKLQPYGRKPKTMGAFANGYPQRSLDQFKELHKDEVRGIENLTKGEYQYATQIAVWATCGQLKVPGTEFTAGRASVIEPTSSAKQIRVFDSVKAILKQTATWTKHLETGMSIRAEENKDVRGVQIINEHGLEGAATEGKDGIKKETINGKEYYTRVMYVSSATSTWIDGYTTKVYSKNAPEGTIFVAENNSALETVQENGATCYKVDTSTYRYTDLNGNGVECYGSFKVCIPADNVTAEGSFTIKATGGVAQYNLFLARNPTSGEQSYIIADPAYTTIEGQGEFKWTGTSTPETPASVQVIKAGAGGAPLEGAKFTLTGSGGTVREGETDRNGQIIWTDLPANEQYTLAETQAPAGYQIVAPMNVKVTAGKTEYVTVTDETVKGFTVKKIDAQNKGSLQGAVFRFEQIDGNYTTTGTTGFDGTISFQGEELPYGTYRVTEETPPDGYQRDTHVETVVWDGKKDVLLTFTNVRDITILLVKKDADTGICLPGATFDVYADGEKITSVTTNDAGEARITGIRKEAYIEVVETIAPDGYVLDPTPHGIHVDAYNPALENDPILTVTNKVRPAMRILKYDKTTNQPMPDVTFEIYRNTVLIGEYTTNENGEILLFDLEPGTYLVKEIATDDNHVVNSTPQQVELKAGQTTTVELAFFNSQKPGMYLIKVDSVTMKSLPNVRFEFKKVGGSYKQEFVTDANGEINLSKLEPGAYEVRELEAPEGYLIDEAVRVIQLNPDETASFIFTNTTKPSMRLIKTSSDGSRLAGVHFRISKIGDASHYLDRITDANGEINIDGLEPGIYLVKETATTPDHIPDIREYRVELFPGKTSTITIENQKRPKLTICKTDKDTGDPVPGVTFTLKFADGHTITTEPTGPDGTVTIENLLPGVYTVIEQSVPEGYILDTTPQQVTLVPNRNVSVQFQNFKRPTLKIVKVDINGKHLEGAIFEVKTKAGVKIGDFPVGTDGTVTIPNIHLEEGYYIITEIQAPKGYILDKTPHEVYLRPGKTTEVSIENEKKPGLIILKIDSVVGDGVKGAKFELWVSKDKTENGTYQKLNDTFYYTDENGMIELPELDTGWYKVKEVEPPEGYMLKEPSEQIIYVEHDKNTTITFENIPKSALVIRKIDADTGAPLVNAWFRVRYLGGTSGSGGTIIGEFNTSSNGNIVLTGLEAGTYIVEEINAPNGYVIDTAPQTAYISGKKQDCITLTFTNSKYGSLLIKKVDSVTGDPLSGVEFFVTTSDGTVVGNNNGFFTTDRTGTALVPDIKPGTTLVVKETRAPDGYTIDETPKTIKVLSNETMTVEFRNQPLGSLLIRKVCSVNPSVTLKNAEFKVAYTDGTLVGDDNGVYRTDENGEVRISGLIPGKSVVVTETRAPAGFIIDTQSQTAQIKEGKTVSLTFKNQPKGSITIQKRDSQTNQPLAGAQFRVTTAAGCEVGLDGVIGTSTLTQNGIFTTNSDGEVKISNLAPGAYVLTEIKAPSGYVMDAPSTNVVVGANGDTQTVVITNTRKGGLIVEKYDSVTKQPLAGGKFKITTASGELVPNNEGLTSSNGIYTTDRSGQIVLSKLLPGTYIVSETKAPDNYQIDPTPQTVVVKAGDTQTLKFYDDPLCTLTILKRDSVTKKPLAKAEFLVKDSEGRAAGPNNGRYITGTDGTVTVTGLAPNGTYVVSESKAPTGYIKDETPKNIVVRTGVANTLIFDNEPATTLIIHKYIEGTENEPLSGVAFKVVDGKGAVVGPDDGIYYTDKAGEIVLDDLEPGTTVTAREIKTVDGFVLDGTPQNIQIKAGEVQQLTFWNKRAGTLLIEKLDSVTKKPLAGAQFKVVYADGRVVDTEGGKLSSNGIYTTDTKGQIKITNVVGTIVVTEEKAPDGYVMDANGKNQTVVVRPQDTQTLRFYNEPLCSLTLTKLDSVSGKPVPKTEFAVRDGSGTLLGRYTTGSDGTVTVTGIVPGTTVVVTETKVPSGYVLNPMPQTITVKNGTGNSVTSGKVSGNGITAGSLSANNTNGGGTNGGNDLTFENDPKTVLVIQKYVKNTANKPLKGVEFLVTDSSGEVIGTNNGIFYTDMNGRITIRGLEPGVTITARETKTLEGYVLDSAPQSIKIKVGETQTMTFWNEIAGTLVIQKKDKISGKALAGVEFELTYAEGGYVDDANGHLSSKGRYTTDSKGEIRISGIVGTVVAKEVKTIDGYVIDPATQTQTVTIKPADTQTLKFYNEPLCGMTIIKQDSTNQKPLAKAEFVVKDTNGSVIGRYTTGKDGSVSVNDLIPGKAYVVSETKAPDGYVLNSKAKTITVKNGADNTLIFENDPTTTLIIEKFEHGTKNQPLQGVEFLITDSNGTPIGPNKGYYKTDKDGRITLSDLEPGTTITARETKTLSGYQLDATPQSMLIKIGEAQHLTFWNKRLGSLQIEKLDSVTKKPLAGAQFKVTYADGRVVDAEDGKLSTNGLYSTDKNGLIKITNITGTIVVTELKAPDGHVLDYKNKSQTITVNTEDTQTVTFYNEPLCSLTLKKVDSVTGKPVANTEFTVKDGNGNLVNRYTTGKDGTVTVNGLIPGQTYVVTESRVPSGYVLNTQAQTITVRNGENGTVISGVTSAGSSNTSSASNELVFENAPKSTLVIEKFVEGTNNEPLKGVEFLVTDGSGAPVGPSDGHFYTDKDGRITITDLEPGMTITARETKTIDGYVLDGEPKSIEIKTGKVQNLTFWNKPAGVLVIQKKDKISGKPLAGVEFELTYSGGGYVDNDNGHLSSKGRYTTDDKGEIRVSGVTGTIVVKEVRAIDGYIIDPANQTQTVKVNPADTQTLKFYNEPLCSLTLKKVDSVTGKPVPNTEFTVKDGNGNIVNRYTTGKDGTVTVNGLIPGQTYVVTESRVPSGYVLNTQAQTITVKNSKDGTVVSGGTTAGTSNSSSTSNELVFENAPKSTLEIYKFVNGTDNEPLKGVEFFVTDGAGTPVGTSNGRFYTDKNGRITITDLEPGMTITARETKTVDGYVLDGEPQSIEIKTGKVQSLTFWNKVAGNLVIQKKDKISGKSLSGVEFELTYAGGGYVDNANGHLSSNGRYTTDDKGEIRISGIVGTVVVKEVKTIDGYVIDPATQTQTVKVNPADTQTIKFYNEPLCSMTIIKQDATNRKPLANAEFIVKDGSGVVIDRCTTGKDGTVSVNGLVPGQSYVVSENKAPDGYTLNATPKTITVKNGAKNELVFENSPTTTLVIQKFVHGTDNQPLKGVEFLVTDSNSTPIGPNKGCYKTDQDGRITISGLEAGTTVTVRETKTLPGYELDGTPQDILIKVGEAQHLTFWNKKLGTLQIEKLDSVTKKPLAGAQFKITYADGRVVDAEGGKLSSNGLYTTDVNGQIKITDITGTIIVTELKAPDGYVLDYKNKSQTVTVNTEDTQTLTFYNEPLCSMTLKKIDSVTGKPVPDTEFTVKDSSGNIIGRYTTGKDGTVTVNGLIPGNTYVVTETRVPAGYVLNTQAQTVTVRNGTGNSMGTGTGSGTTTETGTGTVTGNGTGSGTVITSGGTNEVVFENAPKSTLQINKYVDGTDNEPLKGVEFLVTDGAGTPVGSSNGYFYTDKDGRITINDLEPGTTLTVKETKTVDGFVLNGDPQTVKIQTGKVQSLTFWNKKAGSLVIQKKDKLTGESLSGVEFELTYAEGGFVDNANGHLSSNGRYTTDDKGEVRISGITGTIVVKETKTIDGYMIDPTTQTQTVTVNPAETQTLVFYNTPKTTLTLQKYETGTTKPLAGVTFLVTTSDGSVVGPNGGEYITDQNGRIVLEDMTPGVTVTAKETETIPGYKLNSDPKSIQIKVGEAQSLTFYNEPLCNLTIVKKDSKSGAPLAGAQFLVTDQSGAPVGASDGHFTTGANGMVTINNLTPGASYTVREEKAPAGYTLNQEPQTIVVKSGQDNTLTFVNEVKGRLILLKLDSKTKKPISGVEFKITASNGEQVSNLEGAVSSNGLYITDQNGEINLTGLAPDTYIITETKAADGYLLNTSPTTVKVTTNNTQTIRIYNDPTQTLTIQKFEDGTTKPIQGVTFLVTDSSGKVLGPNNGEYVTDKNGRIVLNGLTPGTTITAKETKAAKGFVLDSTPQSILVKEGEAQTLTFYNKTQGGLELIKVSAADKSQRIPGVTFEIRKKDGALIDKITTDKQGCARLDLEAGDYYAVEIETVKGFKLDATPEPFTVKDGKKTTLTVTNKPFSGIMIHKTDSITGRGIYGATFLLYDSTNKPIGQYSSDNSGYVYIEDLTVTGRYYLRELENKGYIVDTQMKTVYVTAGATTLIEWKNTPITGQIQIVKKSADYNSTNGLPAGTLLADAVFEIYDKANNVVDTIKSDKRGLAVSKQLPLGRYTIKEVKAPANYGVNENVLNAYLEHEGQILTFEVTDKSLITGVSITKTGPKEVMAGQPVNYTFSSIANNSNVRLDSFYWRDTLPSQVVMNKIVTGTYNFPGNYKIVYRVNGGEYQTLADNLSTSKNYSLAASPVALGLASDERVTEVMFVFGQAPAGFSQVEKPCIYCVARSGLPAGSFVNKADVGGVYNGEWIQAVSRWVTKIYKKTVTTDLPKTGY